MQAYIAKRILLFIPTLILITLIVFLILRVVPGDPALMLLAGGDAQEEDINITEEQLQRIREKLGTDKNIFEQYGRWMWGLVRLDFGDSFYFKTPVSDDLKQKYPVTIELAVFSVILATLVAVPIGVLSAIKQDTPIDYLARIIAISGIALPNFWVAILMILVLVVVFDWVPIGYVNLWEDPVANLRHMVFPALALSFSNMAFIARVTRSSMLEVFREDYIRTARAKGLTERVIISRHALRNAILPVVTASGYEFGRLLAGTLIIEVIFVVPGVGRLLINSVLQRDFTMVQALVVSIAVVVVVINLLLDLLYAWLNPRIRYT
jgi:peptide/nickel transport system permease protein